ncbi:MULTISPECIES: DUF3037 domain-containing protein [unclassified Flavobacterium]|uniref:DUF3037 domain-containing protein n=1 Tax=unclassified Flavobacterium TaxID=196869 RepID=UPI0013D4657E|nr:MULTISPECIES: DUF3037 domain-containing protein [unclassified Flavobacterium]MBA5792430.1 DUF3037 domain-containing protein [Flavobacterium sp. xlx-221]
MQDKVVYEYAVIRVVPRVEREEFINIGLILFSKRKRFIRFEYQIPEEKIRAFCKEFDTVQLQQNLESFAKIVTGAKDGGPIALLEADEKFRWITAVKSSSIQSSRPHPGFSSDLNATFDKLYNELVK